MMFKNGIIGHLTGSYDAGGSYGLETLEVVGSEGRFVLLEACEHLTYYPRFSKQTETYDYLGGMMNFSETFKSRITKWIDQNVAGDDPTQIDASGAAALHVQHIIESIIQSWETGTVITL
jgi:predicted dehydrogenase